MLVWSPQYNTAFLIRSPAACTPGLVKWTLSLSRRAPSLIHSSRVLDKSSRVITTVSVHSDDLEMYVTSLNISLKKRSCILGVGKWSGALQQVLGNLGRGLKQIVRTPIVWKTCILALSESPKLSNHAELYGATDNWWRILPNCVCSIECPAGNPDLYPSVSAVLQLIKGGDIFS